MESLLLAYSSGIFPWPTDDYPLAWFAPPRRAIIDFEKYHPTKRFLRWVKNAPFTITFDHDYQETMRSCSHAHAKGDTGGTWITDDMISAYYDLHQAGFAHSCEVWNGKKLVGGLYGVSIGQMFAAESMFHSEDNASKLALHSLIELLRKQGVTWIDVQVINPFTESLGAIEISRAAFMKRLGLALKQPTLKFVY